MSKQHVILRGTTVLALSLAYGCSSPATTTGVASGSSSLSGAGLIANNAGGLIANNAGGLISNNAGGLISNNAGGLISNNAGGLISNNAGGLISNNAGGLISNNAGGLTGVVKGPSAGLISNNAGGLISNNAGGLISNNAGGLISNNAGGLISNNAGGYRIAATDDSFQIVAGAKVAVFNERNEQISYNWVTTGADGTYTFKRLKASGPILIVKAVFEQEGQQVSLMSVAAAPRNAGLIATPVDPATTFVAKKVTEMVRTGAVNVATVHAADVVKVSDALKPRLTDLAVVAAAIEPADTAAQLFDAAVKATPSFKTSLDKTLGSNGGSALVAETPKNAPGVAANTVAPAAGDPGNPSAPTPAPTVVASNDANIKATIFTIGKAADASNLAVSVGNTLIFAEGASTETGAVNSLTAPVSLATDASANAKAIAFDGATRYTLLNNTLIGNGKSIPNDRLGNCRAIAVSNGIGYAVSGIKNSIYKVDIANGTVSLLAGNESSNGIFADGAGSAAGFNNPYAVAVANGIVYVADTGNNRIRKIDAAGNVTTLAGTAAGSADGSGASARFQAPSGITTDGSFLYVADNLNNALRRVAFDGTTITIAGNRRAGNVDGTGTQASFTHPNSIGYGTVAGTPTLFVGQDDNTVRAVSGW